MQLAQRRSESLENKALLAQSMALLGTVACEQGNFSLGEDHFQRAARLAREIGDPAIEAEVYIRKGTGAGLRLDYAKALEFHARALAIFESSGDPRGQARALDASGFAHFKQGKYDESRRELERALKLFQEAGDEAGQYLAYSHMGHNRMEQSLYREAIEHFQSALRIQEARQDRDRQEETISEMGFCYLEGEAYPKAISCFTRALDIAAALRNLPRQAANLYKLGDAHNRTGDLARALEYFQKALAIREELGDRRAQAWNLTKIGDIHFKQGKIAEAISSHLQALRLLEKIEDWRNASGVHDDLGILYMQQGDHLQAIASFQKALETGEKGDVPYRCASMSHLALACLEGGQYESAIRHGESAVSLARSFDNLAFEWKTLFHLGRIQRRTGASTRALESFRESLAIIEKLRQEVTPEDETKTAFQESKQAVYAEAIDFLEGLGGGEHGKEALETAERAKSRAYVDLLGSRALEKSLNSNSGSELTSQAAIPPLSANQLIEEARSRKGVCVEYFAGENRLFIWLIEPGGPIHCASYPVSRLELERIVDKLRREMGALMKEPEVSDIHRRLHAILIEPIAGWLPRNPEQLVTIVPHGPLFYLSFAALLDRNGRHLVEDHTLNYLPALSVYRFTRLNKERLPPASEPRILIAGNPTMPRPSEKSQDLAPLPDLPDAALEAKRIALLFPPEQVTKVCGNEAGEAAIRKLLPGHTILHFASHAILKNRPFDSFVALAPADPQDPCGDGFLTVREMFDLDLRADLAVFSACNTGLGTISGDGVMGFSRAILYAGAASALVSLWKVADPVAPGHMEAFYRQLKENGGNKAMALRQAQLEILQRLRAGEIKTASGRTLPSHPIFWAPFILIGEPD